MGLHFLYSPHLAPFSRTLIIY